jgi:hypothetical protein
MIFRSIFILLMSFSNMTFASTHTETADIPFNELNWKVVLMTGDDSISAFDNARKKIADQFESFGMLRENLRQLSRKQSEQNEDVIPTSASNLKKSLEDLEVGEGDGCVVHMTSHGTTKGFYIKGQPYLTPRNLDQMLIDTCGTRPTVILVSACYSGVFSEPHMRKANRFIMTAARKDRTSFGCSPEAEYTYWDGCLIDELENSTSWRELSQRVETCIERKESRGGHRRSYPQVQYGSEMENMAIFHK